MNGLEGRLAALSAEQRAQLSARLAAPTPESGAIAVLGMGCRFPGGGNSPEAFWRGLCEGRDGVGIAPANRWGARDSRRGGFLDQVDMFDAEFFGVSPREAANMDPQQRLLLETAFEALEDAGQLTERLSGCAAGVFIGAQSHSSDYYQMQAGNVEGLDTYTATGTAHSILANRLSFLLDLRGPSFAVDTACSSSLVAVHLACQSLRARESELAIAGGVNLLLTQDFDVCLSKLEMLAPDGRCKSFDHRANGYVRGEGCGVIVLKRLPDALRDGDPILAVILGSAVNQDGASNGLTAPSGPAQQAVIRRALEAARVAPERVGFVETHGTGTALGDPIEVESLAAVLGAGGAERCYLGALKSNVGHLEAASGIAGLIKVILCLRHGAIPPNLHFEKLNPHIELDGTRFALPAGMEAWPRKWEPRIAGVSSFGFGGTNAHVVLADAPEGADAKAADAAPKELLLTISARSEGALRELAASYIEFLTTGIGARLCAADIAYSAAVRRRRHEFRWSVAGVGPADWAVALRGLLANGGECVNGGEPAASFPESGRCVELPRYPWQRQRHWLPGFALPQAAEPGADWFYEIDWQELGGVEGEAYSAGEYIVAGDAGELAFEFKREVELRGGSCRFAKGGSADELRAAFAKAGTGCTTVYFSTEERCDDAALVAACQQPLDAVQGLLAAGFSRGANLWLVTRGSQAVNGMGSPAGSICRGLGRGVALEAPEITVRTVDLDPVGEDGGAVAALLAEIGNAGSEDQIVLRGGRRYAPRLKHLAMAGAPGARPRVTGTHLITGGLGALGSRLAMHLAERGASHLVLVVKRALPERACWDALGGGDPEFARVETVRHLEAAGAKVTVVALDLADGPALTDWFASQDFGMVPLRGVWHAAMSLSSAPIRELDPKAVREMIAVKSVAAWRLHELTRRHPVEHFVLFSSTTALWGAGGLAHYAAGNAFLDALAHARRAEQLPATVINWGVWEELRGISAAEHDKAARAGLRPMPAAAALAALDRVLAAGIPQAVVADIDWAVFKPIYEAHRAMPLLAQIGAPEVKDAKEDSPFLDRLHGAAPDERRELLATHAAEILAGVLGIESGGTIDRKKGFFDLGMDSLTAIQLRTRLERDLRRPLPSTLVFTHSTIGLLADYLLAELFGRPAENPREVEPVVQRREPRVERAESVKPAAIAIVGMGCRYPGGVTSPDTFWELLRAGKDAITEVPAERWGAGWYDADSATPGKMSSRWGGFVDGIDRFDAQFFGIAPREAAMLDPQHRIVLEVAWEALEHAGQPFAELAGSETGVFVGITNNEYYQHLLRVLSPAELTAYVVTGNVLNAAAGRLAFLLGTHGPSVAVDTACSSSLTAIHLACQSLRAGDCGMALAGGVNAIVVPETCVMFSKWGMMAADGRCKAFDAAADGFVRAEGCGVVVLKRLSDAVAAGDRVLAVIEGSAVNQDGHSSGLTVPNGRAQQAVIRRALASAGVEPGQIDYVEAHGTGTALGDPIEVDALSTVFGRGRDRKLRIGSVKTNLGHTESASGVAGLIKCVLALGHEEIPAQLHFRRPSPEIPWEAISVEVVDEAVPWPRGAAPRRAGVSSFGFSGANAHVIISEAPAVRPAAAGIERPRHILAFSACDPEALAELAARHVAALRKSAPPAADYCFTADTGRAHFQHRAAVCGVNSEELADALSRFGDAARGKVSGEPIKVAFLFSGEGSQYAGMGGQLYESQPIFRAEVDRCAALLEARLDRPLAELMFAPAGAEVDQARYAGPMLFALEWSLAQLWRSWGIEPAALLGHGVGETVAACQAGVMSLEDGLALIAARGRVRESPDEFERIAGRRAEPDPARFKDGVRELRRKGCQVYIEAGPAPVLIDMARKILGEGSEAWLPSLTRGRDEWTQMLESLSALYVRGVAVDWVGFDRGYERRRVALPTYPFRRKRFWVEEATVRNASGQSGGGLPPVSVAAGAARQNRPGYLEQATEQGYADAARLLDARSLHHARSALRSLGWNARLGKTSDPVSLARQLGVQPKQERLLGRLLQIAGGAGGRELDGEDRRPNGTGGCAAELALLEHCGKRLGDVLRGVCDPLELLFDPGLSKTLETIYSDSLATIVVNRIAADVVGGIAGQVCGARKLRVLEIGAGTGGTTRHIVEQLPAEGVEYWFTDVSPGLVGRGRLRFGERPFMRFEPLDIERAVESQGFAGRDFDVVVAANVLHATADLRAGLGRIRRLLVPGGLLVLIEGTRPQNWIDLTFGLTDGWWKFSDRELRKDHPLLETAGWLRLLEEEGFPATVELAGPAAGGQAADFTVFVASRAATRSAAPAARAAAKVAPMPVPRLDGIAPQKRRKMIQSVVRDSIIGVLGLETDFQIDPLQGFTDLGFDSLTSLELRNRLQAQMGRPLPATLAFDFPTMAALVNYFCKESMEAPEAERELEDFELAQLSAEETEQLLAEELAKTRGMP